MGAAALTAEIGNFCVPLAVGSAVGSSCTAWHDQLSQRVCVVDGLSGSSLRCKSAGCTASELPFAVMGMVHDVQLVKGVVGTFTDNEPVIGVRARTLPFTQAIGQLGHERQPADGLPLQRYSFGNFPFLLPGMLMEDVVVIAFGTRTVVRLPLIGATNAPLNFDVLGTATVPVGRLVQSAQPVELGVSIQLRGESLPQVARATLTFTVAPQSLASPTAADDTDIVEPEVCMQAAMSERLANEGRKAKAAGQCANFSGAHQFNAV